MKSEVLIVKQICDGCTDNYITYDSDLYSDDIERNNTTIEFKTIKIKINKFIKHENKRCEWNDLNNWNSEYLITGSNNYEESISSDGSFTYTEKECKQKCSLINEDGNNKCFHAVYNKNNEKCYLDLKNNYKYGGWRCNTNSLTIHSNTRRSNGYHNNNEYAIYNKSSSNWDNNKKCNSGDHGGWNNYKKV